MMTLPPKSQNLLGRFLKRREAKPIPPSKSAGTGKTMAYAVMRPPTFSGIANAPRVAGAVIVNVELPELDPTATEAGETLQPAKGAGPVTTQPKFTCPEYPF